MIKCLCINDSDKPFTIPQDKWIKKDSKYHVVYIRTMDLQNGILGVVLKEIDLDSTYRETGYCCFKMSRFLFREEDIEAIKEMMADCHRIGKFDLNELLEINEVEKREKVELDYL